MFTKKEHEPIKGTTSSGFEYEFSRDITHSAKVLETLCEYTETPSLINLFRWKKAMFAYAPDKGLAVDELDLDEDELGKLLADIWASARELKNS